MLKLTAMADSGRGADALACLAFALLLPVAAAEVGGGPGSAAAAPAPPALLPCLRPWPALAAAADEGPTASVGAATSGCALERPRVVLAFFLAGPSSSGGAVPVVGSAGATFPSQTAVHIRATHGHTRGVWWLEASPLTKLQTLVHTCMQHTRTV